MGAREVDIQMYISGQEIVSTSFQFAYNWF